MRDHTVMASGPRPRQDNEQAAAHLSGQVLVRVRYFLLTLDDEGHLWDWDFGAWHQPTMGVELTTEHGDTFSATWGQYDWGYGVDLFHDPMSAHLITEAADNWTDVSNAHAWSGLLGTPIQASFLWNDYGTGQAPCPEALMLNADHASAWIIAADWNRQRGKTTIQLGTDDLLVVFDSKLVNALGLLDSQRGRAD